MHTLDIFAPERRTPAQRYYRIEPSRAQPITLAEAKSFLRVDHDDDNEDIKRFIKTAVDHLDGSGRERDGMLGKALLTQVWALEAERPDRGRITIEHGIVQKDGIVSVEVMQGGAYVTWDPANYRLGFREGTAFVAPSPGQGFPQHDEREDAFLITYVCGYGDRACDLPQDLVEAMRLHIGHLYENRQGVYADARGQSFALPFGYMDHVRPHRVNPSV